MIEKIPQFRELHECEKSEGKIVSIISNKNGTTSCGYCYKIVDYSPLWNNKEFQNKIKTKKLEAHRKESYITCAENCWCWEYEIELYNE